MFSCCGPSSVPHLNLNVADFSCGADDGPAHQRREDVLWKVGACIATLHKLHTREKTGRQMDKRLGTVSINVQRQKNMM